MRAYCIDCGITPDRAPPRLGHNCRRAEPPVWLCDLVRLRCAEAAAAPSAGVAHPLSMSDASTIHHALDKGVAYLESVQLPSGEIPIDKSPTSEMSDNCVPDSSVFPAALAARALSITSSAERLRSRALDFLQREMNR